MAAVPASPASSVRPTVRPIGSAARIASSPADVPRQAAISTQEPRRGKTGHTDNGHGCQRMFPGELQRVPLGPHVLAHPAEFVEEAVDVRVARRSSSSGGRSVR